MDPTSSPPPYLRVHAVNIYVRDQDLSVHFYVEQLGFNLAFDVQLQTGERWVGVTPQDGSSLLMLVAPKPDSKEYDLIGRPTGVVLVAEDVVAKYGEWRRRGVKFHYAPRLRRVRYDRFRGDGAPHTDADDHTIWGGVFTHFHDIDGNAFALVSLDEVSRGLEIERRALEARREEERRAAQELDIAKTVQARLFPQTLPCIPSLEYAGTCIQAREVGGDYYDFIELGPGCFGLVIGDIAGKGIAGALLMANLQANVRIHCAMAADQPRRLLRSVNRVFHQSSTESAYATMFFAEYDDENRRLRYANCGHLPGLLIGNGARVDRLDSTAMVLGLFADWDCTIGERTLCPGELLALYTDGITEAMNANDEEFGEERLIGVLQEHRHRPVREIIDAVVDEVKHFSTLDQRDDITITIARCKHN